MHGKRIPFNLEDAVVALGFQEVGAFSPDAGA
jgi:hypothetical protein